jgi:L-asparaginase II
VSGPFESDPIVVEVVRNGYVESVHRGRVVVTDPGGTIAVSVGADLAPMYPRSALKPLQTVGMVRAGLDLEPELLALVAASHSGEPMHIEGVRRILGSVGLDESALQTPADWPLDEQAREAAIRSGGQKTPIAMNCSGKHAGMIASAAIHGWPIETYRDPDHPVQRAILQTIDDLTGEQARNLAVDGCGAPAYAVSLAALARAYGRLAAASTGPEQQIADAIRAHPAMASGSRRDECALHRAIPGLLTKAGAEAVQAVGLPDGRGLAVKISDGSPRARPVAMAGVLQRLGLAADVIAEQASAPVLGHGERVGEIRPCAETLAVFRDILAGSTTT